MPSPPQSPLSRLLFRSRQTLETWLIHPDFRIHEPAFPEQIAARIEALLNPPSPPRPLPPADSSLAPEVAKLFIDTALFLWRLRRRASDPKVGLDPKTAMHAERLEGALHKAGVEVIDPTGKEYNPGQDIRVIAFQPSALVTVPTVRETVQPFVFFRSQMLLRADIIVDEPALSPAQPAGASDSNPATLPQPNSSQNS